MKVERSEHLAWCKERAIEELKRGDIANAVASMMSDMSKHPETRDHSAIELGMMLLLGGHLSTQDQAKNWIVGFN